MNRVYRKMFNVIMCLVFLISSFAPSAHAMEEMSFDSFSAPIAMKITEDGSIRLFVDEDDFSFDVKKAMRIFLQFLSLNKKDLWVSLTPDGAPCPLALRYTDIAPVFLRADIEFKRDISELLFPYLMKAGSIEAYPRFWILPGRSSVVKYSDNVFAVKSLYLKVKSRAKKQALRFVKMASQRLQGVISKDIRYEQLRDIYAIYVLAMYFKRKQGRKLSKAYSDSELNFISGVNFDPYLLKSEYIHMLGRNINKFFRGNSFVFYLGGVNFSKSSFIRTIKEFLPFPGKWKSSDSVRFMPKGDFESVEQVYVHIPYTDGQKSLEIGVDMARRFSPCRVDFIVPDALVDLFWRDGLNVMGESRFSKLVSHQNSIFTGNVLLVDNRQDPVKDGLNMVRDNVVFYSSYEGLLDLSDRLKNQGLGKAVARQVLNNLVDKLPFYYKRAEVKEGYVVSDIDFSAYVEAVSVLGLRALFRFFSAKDAVRRRFLAMRKAFPQFNQLLAVNDVQGVNLMSLNLRNGRLLKDVINKDSFQDIKYIAWLLGRGSGRAGSFGMSIGNLDDYVFVKRFLAPSDIICTAVKISERPVLDEVMFLLESFREKAGIGENSPEWIWVCDAFVRGFYSGVADAALSADNPLVHSALDDDAQYENLLKIVPQREVDELLLRIMKRYGIKLNRIDSGRYDGRLKTVFVIKAPEYKIRLFRELPFWALFGAMMVPVLGVFWAMGSENIAGWHISRFNQADFRDVFSIMPIGIGFAKLKSKAQKRMKKKLKMAKKKTANSAPSLAKNLKLSYLRQASMYVDDARQDTKDAEMLLAKADKEIRSSIKELSNIRDSSRLSEFIEDLNGLFVNLYALSTSGVEKRLLVEFLPNALALLSGMYKHLYLGGMMKVLSLDRAYKKSLLMFKALDIEGIPPSGNLFEVFSEYFQLFLAHIQRSFSKNIGDDVMTDTMDSLFKLIKYNLDHYNEFDLPDKDKLEMVLDYLTMFCTFAVDFDSFVERGADAVVVKDNLLAFAEVNKRKRLEDLLKGSKDRTIFGYRVIESVFFGKYKDVVSNIKEKTLDLAKQGEFNKQFIPQAVMVGLFLRDGDFIKSVMQGKDVKMLRNTVCDILSKALPLCFLKGSKRQQEEIYMLIKDSIVAKNAHLVLWYAMFSNANMKQKELLFQMLKDVLHGPYKRAVCNTVASDILSDSKALEKLPDEVPSLPLDIGAPLLLAMILHPAFKNDAPAKKFVNNSLDVWTRLSKKDPSAEGLNLAAAILSSKNVPNMLSDEDKELLSKYIIDQLPYVIKGEISIPVSEFIIILNELPDEYFDEHRELFFNALNYISQHSGDIEINNFLSLNGIQGLIYHMLAMSLEVDSKENVIVLKNATKALIESIAVAYRKVEDVRPEGYFVGINIFIYLQELSLFLGDKDLYMEAEKQISFIMSKPQVSKLIKSMAYKRHADYVTAKLALLDKLMPLYLRFENITDMDDFHIGKIAGELSKFIVMKGHFIAENLMELLSAGLPFLVLFEPADKKLAGFIDRGWNPDDPFGLLAKDVYLSNYELDKDNPDMEAVIERMQRAGYILLKFLYNIESSDLDEIQKQLIKAVDSFPEYKIRGFRHILTAYLFVLMRCKVREYSLFMGFEDGKRIGIKEFPETIVELNKSIGNLYGVLSHLDISNYFSEALLRERLSAVLFAKDRDLLIEGAMAYLGGLKSDFTAAAKLRSNKQKQKKQMKKLRKDWMFLKGIMDDKELRSDVLEWALKARRKVESMPRLLGFVDEIIAHGKGLSHNIEMAGEIKRLLACIESVNHGEEVRSDAANLLISVSRWSDSLLAYLWMDEDIRFDVYDDLRRTLKAKIAPILGNKVDVSRFNGADISSARENRTSEEREEEGYLEFSKPVLDKTKMRYVIDIGGIKLIIPTGILSGDSAERISVVRQKNRELEIWQLHKDNKTLAQVFLSPRDNVFIQSEYIIEKSDEMPLLELFGIGYEDLNDNPLDNSEGGPRDNSGAWPAVKLDSLLKERQEKSKPVLFEGENSLEILSDRLVFLGMDRSQAEVICKAISHILGDRRGLKAELIREIEPVKNLNVALFRIVKFVFSLSGEGDGPIANYVGMNSRIKMPDLYREMLINFRRGDGKIDLRDALWSMDLPLRQQLGLLWGVDLGDALLYNGFNKDKGSNMLFKLIAFDKQYWKGLLPGRYASVLKAIERYNNSVVLRVPQKVERMLAILKEAFAGDPVWGSNVQSAYCLWRQFYPQVQYKKLLNKKVPKGGVVF